jgi:hypothetical protein
MMNERNVDSKWKLSEFYKTELVNSQFHLCRRGKHHDHVDVVPLAASIADVDDNPMALYLGYYNWSTLRRLYVTESMVVHIL